MDVVAFFFLANRIWWSAAVLVGTIMAGMTGFVPLVVGLTSLLLLPTVLIFDTDRNWWPDAVRTAAADGDRARAENRKLILWCVLALVAGAGISWFGP